MRFYDDSEYPVSKEIENVHEFQINSMGKSRSWGTGTQRLAIAKEARIAAYEAGVLEKPSDENLSEDIKLPNAVKEIVKQIAITPQSLNKNIYDKTLNEGISEGEYVEIVGIVSRITSLDVFARGIGIPLRNLPNPEKKAPTRTRPKEAIKEFVQKDASCKSISDELIKIKEDNHYRNKIISDYEILEKKLSDDSSKENIIDVIERLIK